MTGQRIIGLIELCNTTTIEDVESLLYLFGGFDHIEAELNLGEGYIRLWHAGEETDG